jgi:hypothetical protein
LNRRRNCFVFVFGFFDTRRGIRRLRGGGCGRNRGCRNFRWLHGRAWVCCRHVISNARIHGGHRTTLRFSNARGALTPNFHPDIVATSRGHNRKAFVRDDRQRGQFVLDRTEFLEGFRCCRGNQLPQNPGDGLERERPRRQFDLARGRDHIRTLADMQNERVAVSADDGGQQGFDEGHCGIFSSSVRLARTRPKTRPIPECVGSNRTCQQLKSSRLLKT